MNILEFLGNFNNTDIFYCIFYIIIARYPEDFILLRISFFIIITHISVLTRTTIFCDINKHTLSLFIVYISLYLAQMTGLIIN